MSMINIGMEIKETKLLISSKKHDKNKKPVEWERRIVIKGIPKYNSNYALPGLINFVSGDNILELPNLLVIRIEEDFESIDSVGELYYVQNFSDKELGINEPDQFEAEIHYPQGMFQEAWNLVGLYGLGQLDTTILLKAQKTDISGYESIIDIQNSRSWEIDSFCLIRKESNE